MRPERAGAHVEDALVNCRRVLAVFADYPAAVFDVESIARAALERHLITVGEALVRLRQDAPELVQRLAYAPPAIGLRNVLVHRYDQIRDDKLTAALGAGLPSLERDLVALLEAVTADPHYAP
jgi:uncharacterized protein with HEPN domain